MKVQVSMLTIFFFGLLGCSNNQTNIPKQSHQTDSIVKIEMNLSAFGVESDSYPSIHVLLDFIHDSSICVKSYYNPSIKGSTYSLTKNEMLSILKLLKIEDIVKLKKEYTVNLSDQPKSITKIYTTKKIFTITDYGLEGEYPLQELYKIVYKFDLPQN
ncbi:MAG: hypothetical protein ABI199_03290 [Bacteroidia bacterium]